MDDIATHRRRDFQSFLARVSEWSVELGQTWPWKGLLGMVQDIQSPLIVLSSHQLNEQTPIATE